jgi:hypothetical protein
MFSVAIHRHPAGDAMRASSHEPRRHNRRVKLSRSSDQTCRALKSEAKAGEMRPEGRAAYRVALDTSGVWQQLWDASAERYPSPSSLTWSTAAADLL